MEGVLTKGEDIRRQVDAHGRVIFNGSDAIELLLRGCDLSSMLITSDDEIEHYNALCDRRDKSGYQITANPPPITTLAERIDRWFIPDEYHTIAVRQELRSRCQTSAELSRVDEEMDLFEARDMLPVLRLMFYLVDQFRKRGIVWGVGRGSSVASFCLFLIGVHRIHSLHHGLDIAEFLK